MYLRNESFQKRTGSLIAAITVSSFSSRSNKFEGIHKIDKKKTKKLSIPTIAVHIHVVLKLHIMECFAVPDLKPVSLIDAVFATLVLVQKHV